MCGIAGFAGPLGADLPSIATRMLAAIAHRGPDDAGVFEEPQVGLALGHRRLSILDLSPAGRQPMSSAGGRWVIVFNGEIYNHLALRRELEADGAVGTVPWRGHSDTETLLSCFERWGVENSLKRAVGMFAFALWDRKNRTLILARDRIGEKPLYYGSQGGTLLFGSELKALRAHPAWRAEVDRDALALYMRHNAVPSPWTIFRGIRKLPPATFLSLKLGADGRPGATLPDPIPYWSLDDVVARSRSDRWCGSDAEGVEALDSVLREAVRDQMIADVPLGAFLSGGIDSSTVVALMQAQSDRPVKTFSIGFSEAGFNEAEHAKAVAGHLGTDHTELYLSAADARAVIPSLPEMYDEPFADASQIPTHLLAKLARMHVTVSLSGDAGDELFGGYTRYFLAARTWNRVAKVPKVLRRAGAALIEALPPSDWDRLYWPVAAALPPRYRWRQPGNKLHRAAAVLASDSGGVRYRQLVSHWEPRELVIGADEPDTALKRSWPGIDSFTGQMMAWDSVTYLPDDILVKVDRAAMAVSLETRIPFLDHRVIELAWRLPLSLKIQNGEGKWILRQVLYRYVPRALVERPKMGFGVPIDAWLRGPLREWAETLLDEARLRRDGFFRPEPIRQKWAEHLSALRNWQYHLWDVLMFQSWLDRWV